MEKAVKESIAEKIHINLPGGKAAVDYSKVSNFTKTFTRIIRAEPTHIRTGVKGGLDPADMLNEPFLDPSIYIACNPRL